MLPLGIWDGEVKEEAEDNRENSMSSEGMSVSLVKKEVLDEVHIQVREELPTISLQIKEESVTEGIVSKKGLWVFHVFGKAHEQDVPETST